MLKNTTLFSMMLCLTLSFSAYGQQNGSIRGWVSDISGDAIVGAKITATDPNGKTKNTVTNGQGSFHINGLAESRYVIRVEAAGFAVFESETINVGNGIAKPLKIRLKVKTVKEEVEVNEAGQISTNAGNNAGALVLKEEDLDALPEDPEDLENALKALAGGGGPEGGQIYIDGFSGGRVPPKSSIREIRINRDPYSAEYDSSGGGRGRIEIFTKPGTSKFRGQVFMNFSDDVFDARNPFSINKASTQTKYYGGSFSGPIVKNKASFSLNLNNRDTSNGKTVTATVIDPNFNAIPLNKEFIVPNKRFLVNPRVDYKMNDKNTFVTRYTFQRSTGKNQGVGGFSLPSQATTNSSNSHTIQLTETAIINAKTVNETRFQYRNTNNSQKGNNSIPRINVASAFIDGGTAIGLNFNRQKSWELQNYTFTSFGKNSEHSIKFGARVRGITVKNRAESNFGGSFTFTGFLDQRDLNDPNDDIFVSSIEQYRQNLLGNPDPRFNPNQFSINAGNPLADISQYDVGLFIKDDWRVSPRVTLSYGIRYENQTNISDNLNFAPRVNFAYSPDGGGRGRPKTVFRGGAGIFYTRFGQDLSLQARRFDGIQQQQFIVGDGNPLLDQPVFSLNGVANSPSINQLGNISPFTNTPRIIANDIRSPYTIQGSFSVERQIVGGATLSATYTYSKNLHLIRSRNINAPFCLQNIVCPIDDMSQLQTLRPDPNRGNLYQSESSGFGVNQRLSVNFRTRYTRKFFLFGFYSLSRSKGNSDGGFPVSSFDLTNEYTNTVNDRRHNLFLFGSINVPFGISLSPFIIAGSGTPFNITLGRDLNGDSIFNDRPTFGQLKSACEQNGLTKSFCSGANESNEIIPRNFGRGPASITANLRISKTFGFGGGDSGSKTSPRRKTKRQSGGARLIMIGGGGRRKPYNLTLGVRFNNILNTNNLANPVGNINSSLFGRSLSNSRGFGGGGARRIVFSTSFGF